MAQEHSARSQARGPRRRRWLAVAAIVLAIILAPYVVSRVRSPARQIRIFAGDSAPQDTANRPVSKLRVLIYNIAHGRGPTNTNWEGPVSADRERVRKIAAWIAEQNADIVVLNEVDFDSTWSGHQNQAAAIAELAGFPHRLEQRNFDLRFIYGSWKFGNAVLSKFPIVDARSIEYPVLYAWEDWLAGSKQGVGCTLALSPERRVEVLAVHLEVRSEAIRVGSARALIAAAESSDLPTIAAGDFNSSPSDFPGAVKTRRGENAMDVLADSDAFQLPPPARGPPREAELTFTSTQPQRAIDWILIPPRWHYERYRVFDIELSDHRPVMATVSRPAADEPP